MGFHLLRISLPLMVLLPAFLTNGIVESGNHTLRYIIVLNHGVKDIPEYTNIWILDENPLMCYDSNTKTMASRQQFLTQILDDQHWKQFSERALGFYDEHKVFSNKALTTIRMRGPHIYQATVGCELKDDGTTRGFAFYALDGKGFMDYNKENERWTPLTGNSWTAEKDSEKSCTVFLEQVCIYDLKKFLLYGNETLEKKAIPEVKVFARKSSKNGFVILSCLVTGFHPRAITVGWLTNRSRTVRDSESSVILPNEDGTFQVKKTVWIEKLDNNSYVCQVDHSSLLSGLAVPWDGTIRESEKRGLSTGKLIGLLIAVLVVGIVIIFGIIKWRRFKGGVYSTTGQDVAQQI